MYVLEDIDPAELTMIGEKNTGSLKYLDITEEYLHDLLDTINLALERVKSQHPTVGEFQLVYDDSGVSDKHYCLDFHIEAKTADGEFSSRPMRFAADVKSSKECAVGVLYTGAGKGELNGQIIHRQGKSALFSSYRISTSTATPKTPKLAVGNNPYVIGGEMTLLVTETMLMILSRRENYLRDIISFVPFRDCLDEGKILYLANGWRCDGTELSSSSARDTYFLQNFSKVEPKMWLRELYLLEKSKDIRWYCPHLYITKEPRLMSTTETLTRYVNPSTGLQEETTFYLILSATFLVSTRNVLAVM